MSLGVLDALARTVLYTSASLIVLLQCVWWCWAWRARLQVRQRAAQGAEQRRREHLGAVARHTGPPNMRYRQPLRPGVSQWHPPSRGEDE